MNILEKAKKYADEKALKAINAVVEQAYIDGYNDGMRHRENLILENIQEGVEYVDLGLPSGTLWSSKYVSEKNKRRNYLPYLEASKLNIPTKGQFEELCLECQLSYIITTKVKGITFTGITGNSITIEYSYVSGINAPGNWESFIFWLQDDDESKEKACAFLSPKGNELKGTIIKAFMGLKLPIMLVK